jgi:hypothetical protein
VCRTQQGGWRGAKSCPRFQGACLGSCELPTACRHSTKWRAGRQANRATTAKGSRWRAVQHIEWQAGEVFISVSWEYRPHGWTRGTRAEMRFLDRVRYQKHKERQKAGNAKINTVISVVPVRRVFICRPYLWYSYRTVWPYLAFLQGSKGPGFKFRTILGVFLLCHRKTSRALSSRQCFMLSFTYLCYTNICTVQLLSQILG